MNLGVYVITLNEECLIEDTLKHVVKVFPQVEVIDLGSKDMTLECLNRFDIPINRHVLPEKRYKHDPINPGTAYTIIKNQYANKHDWVFFIDGDEIYDEENLLKMKAKAGDERHTAYRVGWKVVRETKTGVQKSDILINGIKLYKTSDYEFGRAWPREVLRSLTVEHNKERKKDCDVWCWHGVLLQRSNSIPEKRGREKKRNGKAEHYEASLTWGDTYKWPWI